MTEKTPTTEDRARAVFAARADLYVTSSAHTDPLVMRRLVDIAQPQAGWRVLDVATGAGHTAFAFAPFVESVVAIDLTPEMLVRAARLAEDAGVVNVRFKLANIHELPFDDETFDDEMYDLVTCRRAAHHFSDIQESISEMVRMLKPGGMLLIDDRSVPDDDFVDSIMNRLDWLHDDSHVRQYRAGEWQEMLQAAGCTVVVTETYIKHRPVQSLTDRVTPDKVSQIHGILRSLSAEQQQKLALVELDGEMYSNHWYITIAARKPAN